MIHNEFVNNFQRLCADFTRPRCCKSRSLECSSVFKTKLNIDNLIYNHEHLLNQMFAVCNVPLNLY